MKIEVRGKVGYCYFNLPNLLILKCSLVLALFILLLHTPQLSLNFEFVCHPRLCRDGGAYFELGGGGGGLQASARGANL